MRGANNGAQANLVGNRVHLPQVPYTAAYVAWARTNKRLPQPPPAPVAAAAAPPPPPYLPSLANYFHYVFQPPYPWEDESDIPEMIPLKQLNDRRHVNTAARNSFLENGLSRCRINDTRWMGARFLGAGTYGAAGLWTEVDVNNNITEVRL
jgi:hypothetical protein